MLFGIMSRVVSWGISAIVPGIASGMMYGLMSRIMSQIMSGEISKTTQNKYDRIKHKKPLEKLCLL